MTTEIWTTPISGEGNDQIAGRYPDPGYLDRHVMALGSLASTLLSPEEKREARRLLAKFFSACELNNEDIDYTQHRPFDPTVDPNGFEGDCSSYPTQAFLWVNRELRRLHGAGAFQLHDPNGPIEGDGWGWTLTLLNTNRQHRVPLDHKFFVGDIAIFGRSFTDTRHATVCRKNGLEADAIFSSHGTRRGPVATRLRYRPDLLGVFRPVSLL